MMRTFSTLLLAIAVATPAVAQEAVSETVGFEAFGSYCLNSSGWDEDPELSPVDEESLSALERRAMQGNTGGKYRFYEVSAEPRVLLAFQWEERLLGERPNGQRVVGVGGRCVIFTHEVAWDDIELAMEELTGISGQVTSIPNQDLLILIDSERARNSQHEPWSFAVSRARETIMYRAIM